GGGVEQEPVGLGVDLVPGPDPEDHGRIAVRLAVADLRDHDGAAVGLRAGPEDAGRDPGAVPDVPGPEVAGARARDVARRLGLPRGLAGGAAAGGHASRLMLSDKSLPRTATLRDQRSLVM